MHMTTFAATGASIQAEHCVNCGAALRENYCANCGQKKFDRHDLTVKHFFGHLVHEFTHLDSNKIIATMRALLFKPGLLTEEYLAGRKSRHLNPIRIYLTISALYFLFAWGAILSLRGFDFKNFKSQPWFIAKAQAQGLEPHVFGEKLNQKYEKYTAVIRFGSILISGLFLSALYRGAKKYYAEHLFFSLHFYSFDFILRCLLTSALLLASQTGWKLPIDMIFLFYPLAFIYLNVALLRVYKEPRAKTFFKAVVLLICETALFYIVVGGGSFLTFALA
jgi:hypothetical protein